MNELLIPGDDTLKEGLDCDVFLMLAQWRLSSWEEPSWDWNYDTQDLLSDVLDCVCGIDDSVWW